MIERYKWVPFFKELSKKIHHYSENHSELVNILGRIGVSNGLTDIIDKDGNKIPLEEIDPFSFVANICKYRRVNRIEKLKGIQKEFSIKISPIDMDFDGLPSVNPLKVWLFPYKYEREEDHISKLWSLYHSMILNSENLGPAAEKVFDDLLSNKYRQVGKASLTQGLFRLAPEHYFPIDSQTRPFLRKNDIPYDFENFKQYMKILAAIKEKFGERFFYELSHDAWKENTLSEDFISSNLEILCVFDGEKTKSLLESEVVKSLEKFNLHPKFQIGVGSEPKKYDIAVFIQAWDVNENTNFEVVIESVLINQVIETDLESGGFQKLYSILFMSDEYEIAKKYINSNLTLVDSVRKNIKSKYKKVFEFSNKEEFVSLLPNSISSFSNEKEKIKLRSLSLKKIGLFSETAEIEFHDRITVFIGLNGSGKTTILKSLGLGLLGYDSNTKNELFQGNKTIFYDLIQIEGYENGKPVYSKDSKIELKLSDYAEPREVLFKSSQVTGEFDIIYDNRDHQIKGDNGLEFPNLVIGFSQIRNDSFGKERITIDGHPKIIEVADIVSDLHISKLVSFRSWIADLDNERRNDSSKKVKERNKFLIDKVFSIISEITGDNIEFSHLASVDPPDIWIKTNTHQKGIPIRLVSQGYQTLLGWVGYVLKRMVEQQDINKETIEYNSFNSQKTVIIIDEIDTYLHPVWQIRLVSVLKKYFINTQFVITTHSPWIVSHIPSNDCYVYRVEDGNIQRIQAYGKEIGFLGSEGFGVESRPKEIEKKLDAMFIQYEEENFEKAEIYYKELKEILHNDPGILLAEGFRNGKQD
jgi:energy-coupling factor transporter ATP-binding protein EcfA2